MLNKLILMGRLTADPELKTTSSGISVTQFTLAVDRDYTPRGEEKKTDFVTCVAWRNTAEFISKYFTKGKLMAIEAKLESRTYENREGQKVTKWEAIVDHAYFGGDKSENPQSGADTAYQPPAEEFTEVDDDDDLPF